MRLTLKRLLVFAYLFICAVLSFISYPYKSQIDSGDTIDEDHNLPNRGKENIATNGTERTSFWGKLTGTFTDWAAAIPDWIFGQKPALKITLWPEDTDQSDRIIEQMNFVSHDQAVPSGRTGPRTKSILIYLPHGVSSWGVAGGEKEFSQCPMSNCRLTDSKSDAAEADAILFRNGFDAHVERKSSRQIWIYYTLESPENTPSLTFFHDQINWTATYRYDSDLVAPYEKFVPYSTEELSKKPPERQLNSKRKTKNVAWFVSNCVTSNRRREYAQKLARHIQVDIYGACGQLKCSRRDANCGRILNDDYRFYLAFENSNCQDYITEKFFVQGLQNNIVPIVMGARKSEYTRSAPPHSFIHVDDFQTPAHLAAYLRKLAQNDTLYNEYFQWKGTGQFINTKFWCRLCAMLNAPKHKFYKDIDEWWHDSALCTKGRWPQSTTTST